MDSAVVFMPNGTLELVHGEPARGIPDSAFAPLSPGDADDASTVLFNYDSPSNPDPAHTTYPIVSPNLRVQAAYLRMRFRGQSHNMAEMLATRKFPGVKTDSVFNEGKFSGQDMGHAPAHEKWLREQATAAGVSVNGKWYCSGLASFPGDPTAWVDSRGDVLRIAREKNLTVQGYVEHKGHEVDPGEDLAIDPAILNREVNEYMTLGSGERREDVAERLRSVLTGEVDCNPMTYIDSSADVDGPEPE